MSARLAPVFLVARMCMATSSWWPSAASSAIVIMERSRFEMSGRDHSDPHAVSVIMVWKSASRSVMATLAASTCLSPSTARRAAMPVL